MLIAGLASLMSWKIAHIHQPQLGRLAHFFSERIYSTIFFASMSEPRLGGMCHGPVSWIPLLIAAATIPTTCRSLL